MSYSHDNCSNNDSHSYLTSQFAEGLLVNYVADVYKNKFLQQFCGTRGLVLISPYK